MRWVVALFVPLAVAALTLAPAAPAAPPGNDDFANARVIAGTTGSVAGSNVGATKETGEPDHAGNPGGHSIWYSWTAPADGNVAFTTIGSGFDTLLAIYTGAAVNALTPVAANDDAPDGSGPSAVSFAAMSGITYSVAVDGFSGKIGSVELSWHPAPVNDNFADAQVLPSTSSGTATGEVGGETIEPGEPIGFGFGTIWYSWTAPADGTYKFDTVGSNFDTLLAVYAGSSLDTLDVVQLNDDDPDRGCCSSWVPIPTTTAGTTYSIAVSNLEGGDDALVSGALVLRWSPLVLGTPASETLLGTSGDEELRGLGGSDVLRGFGGRDAIFGGPGNDLEYGGPGNDFLFDHRGADRLFGGDGDDRLNALDAASNDLVAGGLGFDRCRANSGDMRRGCP